MGCLLISVKLAVLRPTQMAVGYDEVEVKRSKWRALTPDGKAHFLETHPFPAVTGPGERYFMIDGHHMGLALLREGVDAVSVRQVENLSKTTESEFFQALQQRGFVYLREPTRRGLRELPRTLRDLADDPYRSFVAQLRRSCACPKDRTPFAEFRWADFLRSRLKADLLRTNHAGAVKTAHKLLRSAFCKNTCSGCRCLEQAAR